MLYFWFKEKGVFHFIHYIKLSNVSINLTLCNGGGGALEWELPLVSVVDDIFLFPQVNAKTNEDGILLTKS